MSTFKIGDIVARKSYGGDVYFRIADVSTDTNGKQLYTLKGLYIRIEADSGEDDLVLQDSEKARKDMSESLMKEVYSYRTASNEKGYRGLFSFFRGTPGRILHIDSSREYLDMCMDFYRKSGLKVTGKVLPESAQPASVKSLLVSSRADIIIITGHDALKKDTANPASIDSYRNSRYYIQSTSEARRFQPDMNKLCIFAGACQSYFEGIMGAGANFASSPGRVLIHALDPGKVGERVAMTQNYRYVTPAKIAAITQSGHKGIGGVNTRGHYKD